MNDSANASIPISPMHGLFSKYKHVNVQCFVFNNFPSAAAPRGPTF